MADPTLDASDDLLTTPPQPPAAQPPTPKLRRPLLIASGLSLLALGVYLNADRMGLDGDDAATALYDEDAPSGPSEQVELEVVARVHMDMSKAEESKMDSKPASRSKAGVYAMKGPKDAVPQMARSFDPDQAQRQAGILGVMQQQGGHYLANPDGGAFAVGSDDADVWGGLTGSQVGQAYGTGGLGLIGQGRGGGGVGFGGEGKGGRGARFGRDPSNERYARVAANVFVPTKHDAKSTFSIDVDTAAYANTRRYLLESAQLPPPEAVRTEELVNYFNYDYVMPSGSGAPFSVTTEVGPSPGHAGKRLVHIGVQGQVPAAEEVPPRNLVFLLDVSGSMSAADKLPLVKHGLASLTEQLGAEDHVSIVVYAGAAGAVLPPTSGADHHTILAALDRLSSGGGTNGSEGIKLAYELAERTFVKGGINRVILASDGDFNVGISDHDALMKLIERKRESGVFLSVLGVGTGNLNDHMMEQIADKGNGNYAYIDGMAEARKVLVEEAGSMLHTIAKDVKIQVEFDAKQVAEHRLVGYENRVLAHRDFDDDTKDAGEIGAGHTVTAIYEIVPTGELEDDPLMTLNLRYKQPEGQRSRKISTPVYERGQTLATTSTDYRFSAAVAAFAERLRGTQTELSYAEILELAEGSLGADTHCYRHQFLDMVWTAGELSGEVFPKPESACSVDGDPPPKRVLKPENEPQLVPVFDQPEPVVTEIVIHEYEHEAEAQATWMSFALEVLRLLPPLLALPLFVMAYRRPRRRR